MFCFFTFVNIGTTISQPKEKKNQYKIDFFSTSYIIQGVITLYLSFTFTLFSHILLFLNSQGFLFIFFFFASTVYSTDDFIFFHSLNTPVVSY